MRYLTCTVFVATVVDALHMHGETVRHDALFDRAATCSTSPLITCLTNQGLTFKLPCDSDWSTYSNTYNKRLEYTPVTVVIPEDNGGVAAAVRCANKQGVKVQARSGGHSYASYSSGGVNGSMVIDLQKFQMKQLQANGIVTVGGGVRLGELADAIYTQGKRALAHGTCAGVGIGGHFTHGGYGYSSRAWGLALDQIVGMWVVLASGEVRYASANSQQDLYYAMRGAADSIGIATTFDLQTHPAPVKVVNWSLSFGSVTKTVTKSVNTFLQVQKMAQNASVVSGDLGFNVHLGGSTFDLGGTYFGSLKDFNKKIKPKMLENLPTPDGTNQVELDWPASLLSLDGGVSLQSPSPYTVQANFFAKSVVVPQSGFTKDSLRGFFQYVINNPNPPVKYFTLVDLWGGAGSAINTKSADFSAFAHHDAFWVVQNYGLVDNDQTFPQTGIDFISGLNSAIVQGLPNWSAYSNYVDPTLSRDEAHKLYYGDDIYSKLQKIKARLDPKNLFSNPQSI